MTSPDLYLNLLGPFEARLQDGRVIDLRLRTARLLLSWLTLRPRQSGSREEIAALLWSERGEAQARQSLRQTLAVLRRSPIGAVLKVDREKLEFVEGAVQSDVATLFEVEADSAVADLERAVASYRGEFLEGLSLRDPLGQNWLEARRGELRTLATRRFEWLLTAYERAGRYDAAEPVALRLLEIDPLVEAGHRALIRVHLAAGQRALAVRQYQRCRDILQRELSVEPADETKALLRAGSAPDAVAVVRDQPLGRTQQAHNLSRQLTSLVGRDREVEEVLIRLNRYRLVTLTGPGGAGKTRMAVETGFRLAGGYADGIWLVELASIADPELVGEALCGALGVPVAGDRTAVESAIAHLNHREVLLILDNCEHLVAASAGLVEMLLSACPAVSILVTSRESLSVSGESLYRVPSLAYPGRTEAISPAAAVNYSAVQLFVDRAAALIEGFTLTDANTPDIASICKQVDGIPLAIELAVGRLKMMGPAWLAANLSASFLTLRRSSRAGPKHHQTLRAMLDWSYDLLDVEDQTLLRRLAVFAGGCSLASAMRVVSGTPIVEDQVFDLLSSLVEKSLVAVDLTEAEPRYRLLETTRSYALDRQSEQAEPGRQHQLTEHLIERFTEAGDTWPRTPTLTWLGRYEPELDNVRVALEWAFGPEGDAALGVQLATLNIRLWDELSLFRERARWSALAMQRIDQTAPPAIAARLHLGRTSNSAHGDASGFSYADQAVQLFRSADRGLDLGEALGRAGAALLTMETIGNALPYLEDALKVLEPLGPTKPLASCLRSRGVAAYLGGDVTAARTLIGRSMAVCRSVGDIRGVASAQIALAEMDFIAGEVASAIAGIRRMLGGADHNRRQATLGLSNLASYLLSDGNTALARQAAGESLREAKALGWPGAIVRASEHLALVAALEGEAELAARLLGFTEAFYLKGSASREWTEEVTHQRLVAELARQLSPARLSAAMAEGAGWSEQQAIEGASTAGQGPRAARR